MENDGGILRTIKKKEKNNPKTQQEKRNKLQE